MSPKRNNEFNKFREILTNESIKCQISANEQNEFKLNRLIKEILTPLIQQTVENEIRIKHIFISDFFKNNETDIKEGNKRKHLTNVQQLLDEFKKTNNSLNYPNDLKTFDISACCSIVRNILGLEAEWKNNLDDYRLIDLHRFKLGDKLNFARLLRRKFYNKILIDDKFFKYFNNVFNKLCDELNINENEELKSKRDIILKSEIQLKNTTDYLILKFDELFESYEYKKDIKDCFKGRFISIERLDINNLIYKATDSNLNHKMYTF